MSNCVITSIIVRSSNSIRLLSAGARVSSVNIHSCVMERPQADSFQPNSASFFRLSLTSQNGSYVAPISGFLSPTPFRVHLFAQCAKSTHLEPWHRLMNMQSCIINSRSKSCRFHRVTVAMHILMCIQRHRYNTAGTLPYTYRA